MVLPGGGIVKKGYMEKKNEEPVRKHDAQKEKVGRVSVARRGEESVIITVATVIMTIMIESTIATTIAITTTTKVVEITIILANEIITAPLNAPCVLIKTYQWTKGISFVGGTTIMTPMGKTH